MQDVLDFLSELKKNNRKEWMDENKPTYQAVRKKFTNFVTELIEKITVFDPSITGLLAKDCTFRINRDVRFSKDKSPYKTNMGAFIAQGGKKTKGAGYYVHLQPGNCFLGGGIYMPQAAELAKIRQEIDYNAHQLKEILEDKTFKTTFGDLQGDQLKTAPKGYPKDHEHIDLLRFKSFTVFTKFADSKAKQKELADWLAQQFKIMQPLNIFLNTAVAEVEQ